MNPTTVKILIAVAYLVVGVIVNIIDLARGRAWYPKEFDEFVIDFNEFTKIGQVFIALFYVLVWPWILITGIVEIINHYRHKDEHNSWR